MAKDELTAASVLRVVGRKDKHFSGASPFKPEEWRVVFDNTDGRADAAEAKRVCRVIAERFDDKVVDPRFMVTVMEAIIEVRKGAPVEDVDPSRGDNDPRRVANGEGDRRQPRRRGRPYDSRRR